MSRTYRPPETGLSRLEIRDKVTQGRLAWGYISDDESLIMSNTGEVWVRHGPRRCSVQRRPLRTSFRKEIHATSDQTCRFSIRLRPV